jgi:hypothetical protein
MVLNLEPVGDTELWYASAEDRSWSLPLHVEWRREPESKAIFAIIEPALEFYQSQVRVMQALFRPHDMSSDQNQWLITQNMVGALLEKAPGITAEKYYRWPHDGCPPIPKASNPTRLIRSEQTPEPDKRSGYMPFARRIEAEYGISSSIVAAVLSAVSMEAPKWMVEDRRPLELGFCRLMALPFRSNWKQIVRFKCRKWKLLSLLTLHISKQWKRLEELGLPGVLCSPHNIGLKRIGENNLCRVQYVIEALPLKGFESTVDDVEKKRLSCGRTSYVAQYEATIEAQYKYIVEALLHYVRKAAAPFAKLHSGGNAGIISFLPVGARGVAVRGVDVANLPVHIVPPDSDFSVLADRSDDNLELSSLDEMPKVPPVLPPTDDVRQCEERRGVGDERYETAGWMSLLVTIQDKTQGEPVLPRATSRNGHASRVDGA